MVWTGVCYGQQTRVHFIDGILNAQRYCDEILKPMLFIATTKKIHRGPTAEIIL